MSIFCNTTAHNLLQFLLSIMFLRCLGCMTLSSISSHDTKLHVLASILEVYNEYDPMTLVKINRFASNHCVLHCFNFPFPSSVLLILPGCGNP